MNIAFFLFTYPGIGGTETVSNLLAEWFTKKGGGDCCGSVVSTRLQIA